MKRIFYIFALPLLWYVGAHLEGSLALFQTLLSHHGILSVYKNALLFVLPGGCSYTFFYDSLGLWLLLFSLLYLFDSKLVRYTLFMWPLFLFSCMAKQSLLYGLTNTLLLSGLLQLLQLLVFFFKKPHGSFLLYLFPTLYLVHHPYQFSTVSQLLFFSLGAVVILAQLFSKEEPSSSLLRVLAVLTWTLPSLFMHVYPYLYLVLYFLQANLKSPTVDSFLKRGLYEKRNVSCH